METTNDTQPALRLPGELSFELKLPPLPRTFAELARLVDGEETQPISVLKEITAADPAAARLALRRVNSAYYGLRRKAATAEQAVVLLGYENVHRLLMAASLVKLRTVFGSEEHAEVYRQMVRHSIMTAGIARQVAEHLQLTHEELAYTTGLFHNIGRLVLLYNVPDPYEALWSSCEHHCLPTPDQEQAIFGTTYAELGAHAVSEWNLSDKLTTVLHFQTSPESLASKDPALYKLTETVTVARRTTREFIYRDELGEVPSSLSCPEHLASLAEASKKEKDELEEVVLTHLEAVQKFCKMMLEG